MRNTLEEIDLKDGHTIYYAEGDLDGSEVSVLSDDPNSVSFHMGLMSLHLSPKAAWELATHLMEAAAAADREKDHA